MSKIRLHLTIELCFQFFNSKFRVREMRSSSWMSALKRDTALSKAIIWQTRKDGYCDALQLKSPDVVTVVLGCFHKICTAHAHKLLSSSLRSKFGHIGIKRSSFPTWYRYCGNRWAFTCIYFWPYFHCAMCMHRNLFFGFITVLTSPLDSVTPIDFYRAACNADAV